MTEEQAIAKAVEIVRFINQLMKTDPGFAWAFGTDLTEMIEDCARAMDRGTQ